MLYSSLYEGLDFKINRINVKELFYIKKTNPLLYKQITSNLYADYDKYQQLVFVSRGSSIGFRKKGKPKKGYNVIRHSDNETNTHKCYKAAFFESKTVTINFGEGDIKLYIDKSDIEFSVNCNGSHYEVDVYYKLNKTEPSHYYDDWSGEIYFEIYHHHKVNCQKAIDFQIEHKTIFEYKVPTNYEVFKDISIDGFLKNIEIFKKKIENNIMFGVLITKNFDYKGKKWSISKNNNSNRCLSYKGDFYTVYLCKDNLYRIKVGDNYDIRSRKGLAKLSFKTLEYAMKYLEFHAYLYHDF